MLVNLSIPKNKIIINKAGTTKVFCFNLKTLNRGLLVFCFFIFEVIFKSFFLFLEYELNILENELKKLDKIIFKYLLSPLKNEMKKLDRLDLIK